MAMLKWFKNKIFDSMLKSQDADAFALIRNAAKNNPDIAEMILTSHEATWGNVINTFLMQKLGDIDAFGNTLQRTQPYPILNQLGYGYRDSLFRGLAKITPMNLRRFSEYTPVRRAINSILTPILDMPWKIELTPEVVDGPIKKELSLIDETKIRITTNLLNNPNHDDSWRTLASQVVEDILVGGFGSLEVQKTGDPFKPAVLFTVDGNSIRINPRWSGDPNEPRYSQHIGYLGQNIVDENLVQLLDEELMYFRLQPRTNTPFGLGYVETAYQNINAWVGAFEYAEKRASNETPNYAIHLGENIDANTVHTWRQYWESEIEGQGKIPIIGGGRSPSVLAFAQGTEDQLWLKWQELLIRYIAQAFNVSAKTMTLERDINRSTAGQLDADDWDAVEPIAYLVSDYITHKLIHKTLGFTNLRFRWLIRDSDEKRQSEILEKRYRMNSIRINEIREHYDQPPLEDEIGNLIRSQIEGQANQDADETNMNDDFDFSSNGNSDDYVLDRLGDFIKRRAKEYMS